VWTICPTQYAVAATGTIQSRMRLSTRFRLSGFGFACFPIEFPSGSLDRHLVYRTPDPWTRQCGPSEGSSLGSKHQLTRC
jgi:hypothetical protein